MAPDNINVQENLRNAARALFEAGVPFWSAPTVRAYFHWLKEMEEWNEGAPPPPPWEWV